MVQTEVLVSIIVFLLTYITIVSEKVHRTVAAMLGAILMVLLQVIDVGNDLIEAIDFNTIGLLIGMMIIVNIIKKTGVFQYLAILTAKLSKGNPVHILIYFSIITAVASGLLDNVTTILLIVPVSLVIADTLKINPVPFVITEILVANIGGAATLIGDPPNIMIGSAVGFSFLDFVINLGPLMVINFIVVVFIVKFIYKKDLKVSEENKKIVMALQAKRSINDYRLLWKSLIVLVFVIIGFVLAETLSLETSIIAIFGASVLLLISKIDPDEILAEIEWTTLFFFAGLFVLVGALQVVGVIDFLGNQVITLTDGNMTLLTHLILWMSAIFSSFLDNIPYVATMIPLVEHISEVTPNFSDVIWWALAAGACLGGNGTIVGASANVVARGIVERDQVSLSFWQYMKVAFPLMILTILISMVYIIIIYS
jgi:Na+/H+ antiporter NhaD/arsenite permease-like protein